VGDALQIVVDNDGERIREQTVGAPHDKIADVAPEVLRLRPLQTIAPIDSHLPDTKTPRAGGALHPIGGNAFAAGARVDVLATRARRCRILLAPRARARLDVVMRAQFIECRGVEGAALRLTP